MSARVRPPLALCYHAVSDVTLREDPHALYVRPTDLKRQIFTLRRWGYSIVHLSELARLASEGRAHDHVALTFDDGFADNLHSLVPILESTNAVATVFVVTGWLGKKHPEPPGAPILSVDELVLLAKSERIEVGAHTHSHPDLRTVGYAEAFDEFDSCRRRLEELTGRTIDTASYPFGATSPEATEACRAAGFKTACRTGGEGSWSDPFNIPRQDMSNRQTSLGFWLKRDDRYEPLVSTLPGRVVRRAVRRVKARFG